MAQKRSAAPEVESGGGAGTLDPSARSVPDYSSAPPKALVRPRKYAKLVRLLDRQGLTRVVFRGRADGPGVLVAAEPWEGGDA
jgi:hypothetical protein